MEPQKDHKKDRQKAVLGSIIFHVVLLLFFLLYGLKEPDPPVEEKMVSINMDFGTDLKGSGQKESQAQEKESSSQQQKQEEEQEQKAQETSQKTATQESSPVNAKDQKEGEKKGNEEKKETEEQEEVSEELKQAQEQFQEMDDEGGGGEGDDAESGNEGDPSGQPQGEGSLPGAGGSWKLAGRKILEKPQPEKPTEEGKVVVDIWVNQQGQVIRTSPNLRRSNTTSNKLLKLAQEAARKARFNADPNGAVEQKGQFTFVFELR